MNNSLLRAKQKWEEAHDILIKAKMEFEAVELKLRSAHALEEQAYYGYFRHEDYDVIHTYRNITNTQG